MLLFCTKSVANYSYSNTDNVIADAAAAALEYDPWIYVGTSTNGLDYYLNAPSIKEETAEYEFLTYRSKYIGKAKSYKKAWWKTVKTDGDYSQIQTKFYCDRDFAINIASANYDINHNYIGRSHLRKELQPVIPETVFSKIAEIVCNVY